MNPLSLARRRWPRGLLTGLFGCLWPHTARPSTAAAVAPRQPPAVIAFGGDPQDTTTTTTLAYDSVANCCGGIDPAGWSTTLCATDPFGRVVTYMYDVGPSEKA